MNSKSTNRTGVIALMLSRVFLFGCALALATNVSTREVLAQPSVQICKQTTPSPDLTNQVFNFTGANSWPANSGKEFGAVYLNGQNANPPLNLSGQNPFPLTNGQCQTFYVAGHDLFNRFTETVPPGWILINIVCAPSQSVPRFSIGPPGPGNVHQTFQPGDDTVSFDQTSSNVTCTFVNRQSGATACPPPMTKNAAGTGCVCPAGFVQKGQTCVRPLVCNAPFVLNAAGNTCVCPAGTTYRNRTCVKSPECKPPMVLNQAGSACVCPTGTQRRGNECVKPPECKPPMIFNKRNNTCICPAGTVQKGNECVRSLACRPPMVANKAGTACECPEGMIQRGQTCVRDPGKGKG